VGSAPEQASLPFQLSNATSSLLFLANSVTAWLRGTLIEHESFEPAKHWMPAGSLTTAPLPETALLIETLNFCIAWAIARDVVLLPVLFARSSALTTTLAVQLPFMSGTLNVPL